MTSMSAWAVVVADTPAGLVASGPVPPKLAMFFRGWEAKGGAGDGAVATTW